MAGEVMRVPVLGLEAEFLVRVPDTSELIAGQWLPVPLYASVSTPRDDEPVWVRTSDEEQQDDTRARLDEWVALVCVAPRVTMVAKEASGEVLHAADLSPAAKRLIWNRTYQPVVARMTAHAKAAERFFENTSVVWITDVTARRYGQRPSALVGLTDACAAYDFDMAVTVVASRYERNLHEASAQGLH